MSASSEDGKACNEMLQRSVDERGQGMVGRVLVVGYGEGLKWNRRKSGSYTYRML
jgi:hypothetical protein